MKKRSQKYIIILFLLFTIPRLMPVNLSVSAQANDAEQEELKSLNKKGWVKSKGYWYYLNDSLRRETGWLKIKNKWYYLNDQGIMQTGWTKINNNWYYLASSGDMRTGWKALGGKWYYLGNSGAMKTGWTKVKNSWYYLNNSGMMQTGWLELDHEWYYLNVSGVMQKNKWISGKYYLDSNGAMLKSSYTPKGYRVNRKGLWVKEAGNYSKINQPNKKQLPSGAVLEKKTTLENVYSYHKKLPGGGNIKKVTVNARNKTIYLSGEDSKGNWYSAIYPTDELSVKYSSRLPEISSEAYGLIRDIVGEFALAYSWQDFYKMIEINIIYEGNVNYLGANTNAETMGELLYNSYDRWQSEDDPKIEFKKVKQGRIIQSFAGYENNETHAWRIYSDSPNPELCTSDVDAIKLDKEKAFQIIYEKRE